MRDEPRAAGIPRGLKPIPLRDAINGAKAIAVRAAPALGFLALILLCATAYLMRALRHVVEFVGHEGDGPFQLFNPLRRIAAGQTGGIDFQYFHGIGHPYLHYPIFAAAGGDLFASELARQLLGFGPFLLGTLAVFAAATRRLTPTLGLTATALTLTEQLGIGGLATPLYSLGVRAAAPFFILAVLLADFRPPREALLAGFIAGVGFLVGVEHGIAALVMLAVVCIARRWRGLPGGSVRGASLTAFAFLLTAGAGLLAIGETRGVAAVLRYSFVEMPADQFWYFGVAPNRFLARWADVFGDRGLLLRGPGPLLLVGVLLVLRMRSRPADRPVLAVLLGLVAYGCVCVVPYLGYCSAHYLEPAARAALTAALILGWRVWCDPETQAAISPSLRRTLGWIGAFTVGLILLAGPMPEGRSSVLDLPANAREIRDSVATIREGRCRLHARIRDELDHVTGAIDADRAANGVTRPPVIWSTYAGQLEAHYGVFNPECDSAIHAVGPQRREEYVAAFRCSRPDYVVTFRPGAWLYEEWLRNATWDFYEEVVRNYDVLLPTHRLAVWRRKPGEWHTVDTAAGRLTFTPQGPNWFTVPGDSPCVVEVEYEIRNLIAGVPLLGRLPRHLLGPTGCENRTPISLPPYRTTWAFPVFPTPGQAPTFFANTFSLVGGQVSVTRIHVRPLPLTPGQLLVLTR